MKRILLAGESWTSVTTHIKGFDIFTTSRYEEGGDRLIKALKNGGYEVDFCPNHYAGEHFSDTVEKLRGYDAVFLSDIGSNTLLLSDRVFSYGDTQNNKCTAIRDYVLAGGALCMIGGYLSFSGIDARARYGKTAVADVLPVKILPYDDRCEHPEGVFPTVSNDTHPLMQGINEEWPCFLGYNKTVARCLPACKTIAKIDGDPFISVGSFGMGKSAAFTSDCSPHWASPDFMSWKYYDTFWCNLADWLTK